MGAEWIALIGSVVTVAIGAIVTIWTLRYKASSSSVESLTQQVQAAKDRADWIEGDYKDRIERLQANLDGIADAEKSCQRRVAQLLRERIEDRMKAVEVAAKVRELELEVARLLLTLPPASKVV